MSRSKIVDTYSKSSYFPIPHVPVKITFLKQDSNPENYSGKIYSSWKTPNINLGMRCT